MESQTPYEIRWAELEDWGEAVDLIWRTFLRFEAQDYTSEGIENFREFLTDGQIHNMFKHGTYLMMVALDQGKIIGAISVRCKSHISLLFVDENYHRRGVGRLLMTKMEEYLKKERRALFISVKAAPYAVGFYHKLGFHDCAPEEEYSGIRVTSMEKFL